MFLVMSSPFGVFLASPTVTWFTSSLTVAVMMMFTQLRFRWTRPSSKKSINGRASSCCSWGCYKRWLLYLHRRGLLVRVCVRGGGIDSTRVQLYSRCKWYKSVITVCCRGQRRLSTSVWVIRSGGYSFRVYRPPRELQVTEHSIGSSRRYKRVVGSTRTNQKWWGYHGDRDHLLWGNRSIVWYRDGRR